MARDVSTPDEATLRQYLLGTLPSEDAEGVSRWASECDSAARLLGSIDARDHVTEAIDDTAEVARADTSAEAGAGTVPQLSRPAAPGALPELGGYRAVRELGRGGMGTVYEAEDGRLARHVAIKVIATEFAASPEARERFLREARAVAQVEHENVVPILHIGEDAGQFYLVMPLLKGETLDARLKRTERLPTGELTRIAREVASGLAAAHAAGLVHRDVKPANIWLEAGTGRARLLDFGLAKTFDRGASGGDLTSTGAVVGTVHYMAPEQAKGRAVDPRTDLFALGAVLYHAATGRRPFQGETRLAVLMAVANDTPPRAEKLNADLPPHLSSVIRDLLKKNPVARPGSATEVVERLREPAPRPAASRPPSRRKGVLIGAALLFSAVVASAVVVVVRDKDGKVVWWGTVPEGGKGEIVPASPEPPAAKPFPPAGATPDRKIAEWLLSSTQIDEKSIEVQVPGEGVLREVGKSADLPAGDFHVARAYLRGPGVTDDDLKRIAELPRLFNLQLYQTKRITGQGIKHMSGTRLESLTLTSSPVTIEWLTHLKDLGTLHTLWLADTRVRDTDLGRLADFPSLTHLTLGDDQLTSAGVGNLARLPRLQSLWLTGASGESVRRVAESCPRIQWLTLDGPALDAAALEHLGRLKKLEYLRIDASPLADADLAPLSELKDSLRRLDLNHNPKLTAAGVQRLRASLPDCKVTSDMK